MSATAASTARPAAPREGAAASRPRPVRADSSALAVVSPARLAQLELAARLADESALEGRRAPRQGLGLAVAGSVVLWGAIMMVGASLIG